MLNGLVSILFYRSTALLIKHAYEYQLILVTPYRVYTKGFSTLHKSSNLCYICYIAFLYDGILPLPRGMGFYGTGGSVFAL